MTLSSHRDSDFYSRTRDIHPDSISSTEVSSPLECRSSTSTAAAAFAIATSASSNPPDKGPANDGNNRSGSCRDKNRRKESVMSTAATMRVLNVLRHWVSKHPQDFELDQKLKSLTVEFLEDIIYSPNLLPAEHKAANQLLRLITKEELESSKIDLDKLLAPPTVSHERSFSLLLPILYFILYVHREERENTIAIRYFTPRYLRSTLGMK